MVTISLMCAVAGLILSIVIQHTQNRHNSAIQTKLDAILDAVQPHTDKDLLGIEDRSKKEIAEKQRAVRKKAQ